MMRLLRAAGTGQPSLLARLVAAAVVAGMIGISVPVVASPVLSTLRWLFSLL
jgi:hypothetical protein